METFWDLHCHCQLFPQTLESIMEPNGVGSKIGLLVLCFAFLALTRAVPVDSHVCYVVHAVGLVPDIAKIDEAV